MRFWRRKREERSDEEVREPVVYLPLKPEYKVIETYWVRKPFAKAVIVRIEELGGQYAYFVDEVKLTEAERRALDKLIDILSVELTPPESFEVDAREHVLKEARRLIRKYRGAVRGLSQESWEKVVYYIERDLLGYGPIDVLMRDWNLEDISCDGVGRAVHVWHRKYESIPTNIVFVDRDYLREFIIKLAHMSGKHVSAAFPIVDAMLPGRHRLAATFGEEVSPRGSTFTIRKFRERPFSITELIKSGNIDLWTAAYAWLMLEHRMTLMVIGATAAGKTTLLNALTCFFKPGFKVVTIEETPELNLPHENWVQLVSRESYGLGESKTGEISLYDLVKLSLRYRPDYIIVGEVRGEEAFVLFQAMATGHGGMSTMHADSLEAAVKRLTSPPMNVSPTYIPSLNVVMLTERTILPGGGFARRIRCVWEVEDYNRYREIVRWNPAKDVHIVVGDSFHISRLATRLGKTKEELLREVERRQVYLLWMVTRNIIEIKEVARYINQYYNFPEDSYRTAIAELEEMGIEWRELIRRPLPKISSLGLPSARGRLALVTIEASSRENLEAGSSSEKATNPSPDITHRALGSLSPGEAAVLKALAIAGGEADYKYLMSECKFEKSAFWRTIRSLQNKGMLAGTLIYAGDRPVLGFKLTHEGGRVANKLVGK